MNEIKKIYNQTLDYFTRNGCTVYTLFGILSDHYELTFYNDEIISTLKKAEKEKVWWEAWGAYFSTIYSWFRKYVNTLYGLRLTVVPVNIMSDEFEQMIEEGYSFGLGLKKANSTYKRLVKDGELSQADVTEMFKSGKGAGHNHRYYKGEIVESIGLVDNTILLSLGALREAVRLGLYYPTARTLVESDGKTKYIGAILKTWKNSPDEDIRPNNEEEKEWLDVAGHLSLKYKIKRRVRK